MESGLDRGAQRMKSPGEMEVEIEFPVQFWVGVCIFTCEKNFSVAFWENLGFSKGFPSVARCGAGGGQDGFLDKNRKKSKILDFRFWLRNASKRQRGVFLRCFRSFLVRFLRFLPPAVWPHLPCLVGHKTWLLKKGCVEN